MLGGMLTYAVEQGIIEKNPAHGIRKPADRVKDRRLTEDEYRLLGKLLEKHSTDEQFQITVRIIRFLALTGCRRGEAIHLKWEEVDENSSCIRLIDSKEGKSVRAIGLPVVDLLDLQHIEKDDGFVFQGSVEGKPLVGFPKLWKKCSKILHLPTSRLTCSDIASQALQMISALQKQRSVRSSVTHATASPVATFIRSYIACDGRGHGSWIYKRPA